MRKSQAQYNKEHLARLRRKAKAFDRLVLTLDVVPKMSDAGSSRLADFVERVVSDAKEIAEAQE